MLSLMEVGTMRKAITTAVAVAMMAAFSTIGIGAAQAAASTQDSAFLADNEQTNLAEQTIGALALQRGQDSATKTLAQMTITDHQAAQTKVTAVAQALGVTLPTAPNPTQQAQAAELKTVASSAFDLTYAQIQVAGHELSIANTQKEISSGSDPTVIAYAQYYLPVAQMHLQMAQAEVTALGGNPGSVPAGTGGMAASGSGDSLGWELGVSAGVLVAALGAVALVRSRRRPSNQLS
jgi:putative membrane protein